jgi:hypothetical protein
VIRKLSLCYPLLPIFKIVVDFFWINSASQEFHCIFLIIIKRGVTIIKCRLIAKCLLVVISKIVNIDDLIFSEAWVIICYKSSLLLALNLFFCVSLCVFFMLSHLID